MQRIANFEKVSYERFYKDVCNTLGLVNEVDIKIAYDSIKLPKRKTTGSAGYDFHTPFNIILYPGKTVNIPTGIRVQIDDGWVLQCYPRSGLGFKYRLQLDNTVGIIDSDYYHSDNEGHIFAKITNCSNDDKVLTLDSGQGFMQGVFMQYGITVDDMAVGIRNGGFGSTDKINENNKPNIVI